MKGKFDYMQLPNHIQFETVSQATKLLEKRRILYEVHEALEQQKEEFSRRKEGLQRHEEIIREADMNIQEHLIKYGQSLIEAEKKTKKTQDRLNYDEADLGVITEEIKKESNTIALLQSHRQKIDLKIRALAKYDEFLKQIGEKKDLFSDTQEMLHRQHTLSKSNGDLTDKLKVLNNEISELKRQRFEVKNEKEDQKMNLNNDLARLQEELEKLELKKNSLQADIDTNMVSVHKQMQDLAKQLMSIDNLFEISKTFAKNGYSMTPKDAGAKKGKSGSTGAGQELKQDTYAAKCEQAYDRLDKIKQYAEEFKQILEAASKKHK